MYQRTVAKKSRVVGIGLHSGKKVTLTLKPAESNTGVVFKRVDLENAQPLKADALLVGATENNTSLGSGQNVVHTVEHLMSALYGLGINNVICEIDGPEVPIMDGSGASFVFLLKEIGIKNLNASKKFLVILEKVHVEEDGKWAMVEPSPNLIIDSTIVFPHPAIKQQREVFEFSCEKFINDISRARTFGLLRDVDMLKRKGLIKGGSLDNAIVLDDYKVINSEGLRYRNEFVKHKILDTIGDISLLGYEIAGKFTTFKSGHYIHNKLCRKILENESSYAIMSITSMNEEVQRAYSLPSAIPSFS